MRLKSETHTLTQECTGVVQEETACHSTYLVTLRSVLLNVNQPRDGPGTTTVLAWFAITPTKEKAKSDGQRRPRVAAIPPVPTGISYWHFVHSTIYDLSRRQSNVKALTY